MNLIQFNFMIIYVERVILYILQQRRLTGIVSAIRLGRDAIHSLSDSSFLSGLLREASQALSVVSRILYINMDSNKALALMRIILWILIFFT